MNQNRRILAHCPRCQGRLLLEQDAHGTYLSCLACGNVLEEQVVAPHQPVTQVPAVDSPVWWRARSA
jgi:hypothetical protein